MLRRRFLTEAALPLASRGASRERAPFRVLYSNDTTNTLSCTSPWHKRGAPFSDRLLEATVDEAEGADVHILQPGLGWIPWWKSRAYPAANHYRWFQETTGLKPDTIGQYMLNGGDMVRTFLDRCRLRGKTAFIGYRLNDAHHLENVGEKTARAAYISRFYHDHPEYRIGTNREKADQAVHNWAIPEVRAHKFAFIRELCEDYDLDGFELDFLRFWTLFRQNDATATQRARIMTGFVADVRALLDRTRREGRRRWLGARIPSSAAAFDGLGIDVPAMAEAGVDIFNVSSSYFTQQQTDLPSIRRMAPRAALYLEMTHSAFNGPSRARYDNFPFLRTTDQQFYTGAHLAYRQGADGVSLFNFVYYREHGGAGRGPFGEPPFHVLGKVADREFVARQPQWYVLAKVTQPPLPNRPLPRTVKPGQAAAFTLEMAPNPGAPECLLRLRTVDETPRQWSVELNGVEVRPVDDVPKPLPHPHDANLEIGGRFACFRFPRKLARTGANQVSMSFPAGEPAVVDYIDLALP